MPQLRLNKRERTVVLAGAGFSKCMGVPLQDELLHRLITPDGLLIHRVVYGVPESVTVGIEDFLTASDFEDAILGEQSTSSRSLRSQITVEILNALYGARVRRRALTHFYENFRGLLEVASAWVTLNWDSLVEAICNADGHPFSYRPASDCLAILKLHGSLDWFKKVAATERFLDPEYFTRIFGNYYRFDPFSTLKPNFPNWLDEFVRSSPPVILAPSHLKSLGDRYIRRIWRGAWTEMAFMDHLVVIGYSLPPADTAMRVLLTRMIRRPRKPPKLRVSLIDPDPTGVVRHRYAELCGKRLDFIGAPFQEVAIKWS